jgi:hypothetical protein
MSLPPIVDDETLIILDAATHEIPRLSPHWSAAASVLSPARAALARRTFSGIGEYTSWRDGDVEMTLRTDADEDVVLDIRTGDVMLGVVVDQNLVDARRDEQSARDIIDAASTVITRVMLDQGIETEDDALVMLGLAHDLEMRPHVAEHFDERFTLARATSRTGPTFLDGRGEWLPVDDADASLLRKGVGVVLVDRMAPLSLGRSCPPMNLHIDLATICTIDTDPMTRLRATAAWQNLRRTLP